MDAIDTLRTWAQFGRLHRTTRPKQRANWASMRRLIEVAKPKLAADGRELHSVLEESRRQLDPFEDPFDLDLGMHRWLAADREEAYSDWLQWIVGQIGIPHLVFKMFGVTPPDDIETWRVSAKVKREQSVEIGHEGCAGRLDLVVRFPGHALIVIEVNTGRAEHADTVKQKGYAKSIAEDHEPRCYLVLLATDGEEVEYQEFSFLPWAHVCVFLRRLAANKDEQRSHVAVALMLAFVGAVEQNLLGMSASHICRVARGELQLRSAQVVDHLKATLA